MDINLRHMRAFVAVAHWKSFSRAASALHISQPALTVHIRNLEDCLRVRLFDRNSRSVDLTSLGREILPAMQRALRELDVLVADTHEQSAGRGGTVRIACLPSFAASLLPRVIGDSRERNPAINFVVRDAVAGRVVELLRAGDVDLGLAGGDISTAGLDVLHQAEDRLCVVFPAGHPLGDVAAVTLGDLVDLPLVLTDAATSVRAVVEAAFTAVGRHPRVVCETTYMMTAAAMVQAGLGVTILPGSAREREAFPGLQSCPIDDPGFVRTVALYKKSGRSLSPATHRFARRCISALEELCPP
jgi:DNA-binding transcriptional LysR family regulator